MLEQFLDGLQVLADLFFRSPIPFVIGTAIAVALIYFKWKLIGHAQASTLRDNFAGWTTPGQQSDPDRLVMRPIKFRRIGIWALMFFGGGALFYGLAVLPIAEATPKDWAVFFVCSGFAAFSVYVLVLSFDVIDIEGSRIMRRRLFSRPFLADLSEVTAVRPISKTIAGGVFLEFSDGRKLRVIARMSGYRRLLELLAQSNLKLRLMLSAMDRRTEVGS